MNKPHKVLFVCLGNICRSAAAEAVMKSIVTKAGSEQDYIIDSAGILSYHEGQPADSRMIAHAARRGYDVTSISRPVKVRDFDDFDIVIGMDDTNIDDLHTRAATEAHTKKIHRMAEFCTIDGVDHVPDPYYGGAAGFENVLDILENACQGLYDALQNE